MWSLLSHDYRAYLAYFSGRPAYLCLFLGYWGFIAAQFIVSSNVIYAWWFYLGVGLPTLYLTHAHRHYISYLISTHPLTWWVIALLAYTLMHMLLLTEASEGWKDTWRHSAAIAVFMMASCISLKVPTTLLASIIRWLLIIAGIMGVASVIHHIMNAPITERLQAFGQNDHPILGANIYATVALMGFYLLHPDNPLGKKRRLTYSLFAISVLLILLTQSRGPLLSLFIAGGTGLILTRHWRTITTVTIAGMIIGADFFLYLNTHESWLPFTQLYDAVIRLFSRESHRLPIWQVAWEHIVQRPLTGYGMQATFPYSFGGVNPHNIFLSAWYYTGITGFILIVGMTLHALFRAIRHWHSAKGTLCIVLMFHAILACFTDQGQYVNSPSPLYSIFWLPIACVIALLPAQEANSLRKNG